MSPFFGTLQKLTEALPNFEWHPSHARIGDNLFLHGDVTNWRYPSAEKLEKFRAFYDQKIHRGALMNFLASLSTKLGLHRLETHLQHKESLCRKILYYFEREAPEAIKGIRNIYFGHTHVPFSNFKYREILFHNTGAAEKGCESRLHFFSLPQFSSILSTESKAA